MLLYRNQWENLAVMAPLRVELFVVKARRLRKSVARYPFWKLCRHGSFEKSNGTVSCLGGRRQFRLPLLSSPQSVEYHRFRAWYRYVQACCLGMWPGFFSEDSVREFVPPF